MSSEEICFKLSTYPAKDPVFWSSMLDTFASIATIVAASLTAYAVYIAVKQLKTSNKQSSIGLYQQYLQLCIEYPEFAKGLAKPKTKDCLKYEQYLWFVATMLNCFEQLILSNSDDKQWVNTIRVQLRKHKEALTHSGSLNRDEWEGKLLQVVAEVVED